MISGQYALLHLQGSPEDSSSTSMLEFVISSVHTVFVACTAWASSKYGEGGIGVQKIMLLLFMEVCLQIHLW